MSCDCQPIALWGLTVGRTRDRIIGSLVGSDITMSCDYISVYSEERTSLG